MSTIIVTDRGGVQREVDLVPGYSLMQALCEGGVDELLALCGGVCSCATCHVYVDEALATILPPMGQDENDLLETSPHRQVNSRLSCQIRLTEALDGLRVTVAPED